MNMSRTIAGPVDVNLHRVLNAWGEGASDAFGQEGGGTAAEAGDAQAFGALPLYLSDAGLDYTASFFEAMSGVTTTGSTAIVGLEALSPGLPKRSCIWAK